MNLPRAESALAFDKRAVADSFSRAAVGYDRVAGLQRLVGDELLVRLSGLPLSARVLDLGCGTGYLLEQTARCLPGATCLGLDIAHGMLMTARQRLGAHTVLLRADAEHLPLGAASVDCVVSNFALQWCGNPGGALAEIRRTLKPGGRALLSMPAQDTFREWRESWAAADPAGEHVSRFLSHEQWFALAAAAGFARIGAARLVRRAYYSSVAGLSAEIKSLGAHNGAADRPRHLMSKGVYRRMLAHYDTLRTPSGRLPASWDVVLLDLGVD